MIGTYASKVVNGLKNCEKEFIDYDHALVECDIRITVYPEEVIIHIPKHIKKNHGFITEKISELNKKLGSPFVIKMFDRVSAIEISITERDTYIPGMEKDLFRILKTLTNYYNPLKPEINKNQK